MRSLPRERRFGGRAPCSGTPLTERGRGRRAKVPPAHRFLDCWIPVFRRRGCFGERRVTHPANSVIPRGQARGGRAARTPHRPIWSLPRRGGASGPHSPARNLPGGPGLERRTPCPWDGLTRSPLGEPSLGPLVANFLALLLRLQEDAGTNGAEWLGPGRGLVAPNRAFAEAGPRPWGSGGSRTVLCAGRPRPGLLRDHAAAADRFSSRRFWAHCGPKGGAARGRGRGRGAQFSGQRRLHEARSCLQAAQRLIQGAGAQEQPRARGASRLRGTPGPGAQLDLTLGHRPIPDRRCTLFQCHLYALELRRGGRTRPTGLQFQVGSPAGATVGGLQLWGGQDGRRWPRRRGAAASGGRELLHLTILPVRTAKQGSGAEDDFHLPRRQHAQLGLGWPRAGARASRETRAGPGLLAAILGADGQARLRARPLPRGHPGPARPAFRVRP